MRGRGSLGLLAFILLVPVSQRAIDARVGRYRAQEEVLYLWSGEHVKRFFPGFEGLAADIYWLRTVQYFGSEALSHGEKRFELLRPLVEITTTLDPRLEIAYRYGAIFLSEPPPMGAGRPREGIELLEKGARGLPQSWQIRQMLGFWHFLYLRDVHAAAAVLNQTAAIPGSPFWLRSFAADLLAKGGDRDSSRRMWRQLLDSEQGILRINAAQNLNVLDSLDMADALTAAVAEFERRAGRRPGTLAELGPAGLWRGPLVDLAGVPFSYDRSSGRVGISRRSTMSRPM